MGQYSHKEKQPCLWYDTSQQSRRKILRWTKWVCCPEKYKSAFIAQPQISWLDLHLVYIKKDIEPKLPIQVSVSKSQTRARISSNSTLPYKKIILLSLWSKTKRYEPANSLKQWLLMIYVALDISLTFCIWDPKSHGKNTSKEHLIHDTRRRLCQSWVLLPCCASCSTCITRDLVFLLWYSSVEQGAGARTMPPITSLHEGTGPLVLNLK